MRIPFRLGQTRDIPQSVRDTFHSTQENQWDSQPESLLDDSDEESDDIVTYDTTMSRIHHQVRMRQEGKKG